ncbi:MAG: thioesterase family protein [Candidatus Caldarchaeum sp.]|nr:thioesterase family protein [Candidatus Caldarchaeum sp.]
MKGKAYIFRIGFQDTDATGRVYFPNYVKWFDIAFIEFLRERGLVFDKAGRLIVDGETQNQTFVIGEFGCRIEKPSGYDDSVTVVIDAAEVGNKTVKTDFSLLNEKGENLARGYITYVLISLDNGKAVEIPKRIREIFDNF